MVGAEENCYWGLIAVLWRKPLPVWQADRSVKIKMAGELELGFPGKEVNGKKVLQVEYTMHEGEHDADFNIHKVIEHHDDRYTNLYQIVS